MTKQIYVSKPWEEDYERIGDPILNMSMFLSKQYAKKIAGQKVMITGRLKANEIGKNYQLHYREIINLLNEIDTFLKQL